MLGACEMALWVKVLAHKPDAMSSIPGSHIEVKRGSQLHKHSVAYVSLCTAHGITTAIKILIFFKAKSLEHPHSSINYGC